jgi:hypothetical protein
MVDDALISAGAGVVGALVGGGAAIIAAAFTARQTEEAAVAKEDRDRVRRAEDAVMSARTEAAQAIIDDLSEMRDVWLKDPSPKADPTDHDGRLWQLHEQVRVRAVILPAPLREDVAVLNRSLRFADELGGDALRQGGFIFFNSQGVARVAFEAAQERLSRFCAGDKEVPWPPDALRLRAAYDEFIAARSLEYEQEGHEYENERSAFDATHPGLPEKVHNAKQLRGSSED